MSVCFFSTHQTPRRVFQISFPNFPDWNWGLHLLGFFILRYHLESCLVSCNLPACCASPSSPGPSPLPREINIGHMPVPTAPANSVNPCSSSSRTQSLPRGVTQPLAIYSSQEFSFFPKACFHYSSGERLPRKNKNISLQLWKKQLNWPL